MYFIAYEMPPYSSRDKLQVVTINDDTDVVWVLKQGFG
jgi:hypothetical protein